MSLVSATAAQRAELQAALAQCGKDLHRFSECGNTPSTTEAAELAATIARAQAALAATGYSTVPTGSAVVANSGTVAVRNSAGADSHNATAVVTGTTLTGVNLAATVALVDNADTVTVKNSAGTNISTAATAAAASGALTSVNLPATVAGVSSGGTVSCTVTTATARNAGQSDTKTVTLTVANGVITAVAIP